MATARIGRIGLGTVQFGLPYGATNTLGQVSEAEAARILGRAAEAGIRVLDTAAAYGEAEALLGRLAPVAAPFRIITKTVPLRVASLGPEHAAEVARGIEASRRRLRRDHLDAVLVHHADDLLAEGGGRLADVLLDAQARGTVGLVGISVYQPAQLEAAMARLAPGIVQLPFNLLDQRFAVSGMLARLAAIGCEVHARSLFLQGTLLEEPEALPPGLVQGLPAFRRASEFRARHGLGALAACLAHGLSRPEIDALVLGVASLGQLGEILAAISGLPEALPDMSGLAVDDEDVIDPSRWQLDGPPVRGIVPGT
jgi:aryl-alcohol dehydrogenase-like predicted oxidoreductase